MDQKALNELNSIKAELRSIINELDNIADGIRGDFKNIGNDKCANCIDKVKSEYNSVLRKLNNINASDFNDACGGGGAGRSF